jgi:DNA modification methylase
MSIESVLSGERRFTVIHGRLEDVLPTLPDGAVHHVITDPPYSRVVHSSVRSSGRNTHPDVAEFSCRTRRTVDLGFDHLSPALRRFCSRQFARLTTRWTLAFSDVESCWMWRHSLIAAGLDYVRTCEWRRIGGAPQFSGDRPASGFETITCAHQRGRKEWNGGGHAGSWDGIVYEEPIVANRKGQQGSRLHKTQKPLAMMEAIISDFSDPGDIILDPFCGSGTTGVACLRLGRRFIGIEQCPRADVPNDPDYFGIAVARLEAEEAGSDYVSAKAGQVPMFGGG